MAVDKPASISDRMHEFDPVERLHRIVLVVRCQAGDQSAFEQLIELYQARLRYFLRRVVDDEHLADDLLQTVWLEVYRGLARLKDPGAFAAWLYQVARHRVLREQRGRPSTPLSLDGIDVPEAEVDDTDFSREDAERIHAALGRLAAEQREVLLLRFFEGMSYQEIARVTGCELGTVRSRIHYSKRALRRALEGVIDHE
jgi:RNA polymerase sigma-70 factor (ECF subfamily)